MRPLRLLSVVVMLALLALAGPAAEAAGAKGRYIVVLKDSVAHPAAVAKHQGKSHDADIGFVYTKAIKGYSAKLTRAQVAALEAEPSVDEVLVDGRVTIQGKVKGNKRSQSTPQPTESVPPPDCNTPANSWGRDRIDQRDLPLSGEYCSSFGGAGVTAYIIDTGIDTAHNEFGGRASYLYNAVDKNNVDCNGHGTHVAGTVGGATYGVAPKVQLRAVRVLDCTGSGYWSWVIAGINAVIVDHQGSDPAVANMSLGGGANSAVDTAVKNAIDDGITFAIAAGNSNRSACNYSPARVPAALTVGATTSSDARASYSNYGSCVDLFAPGSGIKSAWIGSGNNETNTISGTSMATPHVAGVAAQYLGGHQSAPPATVASAIVAAATSNHVGGISARNYQGTPNKLLFTPVG